MSVSESDRRDIYNGLEPVIGTKVANNLMKLLPYKPADELVTRADMHAQTARLQGEMAELRTELRIEMVELRAELKGDMLRLESRLDTRFEARFSELRVSTQRLVAASMAGNTIAVVTALLA